MGDEKILGNKELEGILEKEVKYDSDGVARGQSPNRPGSSNGSVGSSGSTGSSGTIGSRSKRRSWKKPKDKPKRPLSAYNLFFKHERSRIVEGRTDDPPLEEISRSIEQILSTSRETRRHRKTHGRISFGDLARKIAEKWKAIDKERKAVFEHYAEIDMRRYRKELKVWKDKKEREALNGFMGDNNINSVSNLEGGLDDESDRSLELLGHSNHSSGLGHSNHSSGGGHHSYSNPWAPRYSMNSSFSSIDSEISLEPISIKDMVRNPNAIARQVGSLSNIGMEGIEVGVPLPGGTFSSGVQRNGFSLNTSMQNMQPNDVHLFNQQQQLLSNMQFGQGLQQHLQQQQQQQQQMDFTTNDLQQQRRSLERQRQQLMILQHQQQLLQQQLVQQQNNLRMQQGNLFQQQANFVARASQETPMNQQPPPPMVPNITGNASGNDTNSELLQNFASNLDLSNV